MKIIRYPKGEQSESPALDASGKDFAVSNTENCDVLIITYGRITRLAENVKQNLTEKLNIGIVKLLKIFPIDYEALFKIISSTKIVYILEENARSGGLGEKIVSEAAIMGSNKKFFIHAIEGYIEHGDLQNLFNHCGFTTEAIAQNILGLHSSDNKKKYVN